VAAADRLRYGKLVDSVRCIGCKRCMSACKRWNNLRVERDELVSDRETDLTANNWTVNLYALGLPALHPAGLCRSVSSHSHYQAAHGTRGH
jgi:Fe-S-cluster-containing dehydrogenase component